MNGLFDPLRLRGVTLRNRIGVALALALGVAERVPVPCQYYLGWAERGPFRFAPVDPSRSSQTAGAAS